MVGLPLSTVAAAEFAPGMPNNTPDKGIHVSIPHVHVCPCELCAIAPAANGCFGTGGCVSGREGPVNCEL